MEDEDPDALRPRIRPIEASSVHRICSGQVVLDLATAVKELVENCLDAGATNVEVKLKEFGSETIEVADNGSGIRSQDFSGLCLKYHTSKIMAFSDLETVSTYGFRGEALSSLCALSELVVVTRTVDDRDARKLEFDREGKLVSEEAASRSVGTTVAVRNLFKPLPVRHREFMRNLKREYAKMLSVLQSYAIVCQGVRFICTNHTKSQGRQTVVHTQEGASNHENLITIFGRKTASSMVEVNEDLGDGIRVEGFLSRVLPGSGRAAGDRQFFYVSRRPVDLPRFAKVLNEVYKGFNANQYPSAILNFSLPPGTFDINVTPDKRKLFMQDEMKLLASFKCVLEKIYEPSKYTIPLNDIALGSQVVKDANQTLMDSSRLSQTTLAFATRSTNPEQRHDSALSPKIDVLGKLSHEPIQSEHFTRATVKPHQLCIAPLADETPSGNATEEKFLSNSIPPHTITSEESQLIIRQTIDDINTHVNIPAYKAAGKLGTGALQDEKGQPNESSWPQIEDVRNSQTSLSTTSRDTLQLLANEDAEDILIKEKSHGQWTELSFSTQSKDKETNEKSEEPEVDHWCSPQCPCSNIFSLVALPKSKHENSVFKDVESNRLAARMGVPAETSQGYDAAPFLHSKSATGTAAAMLTDCEESKGHNSNQGQCHTQDGALLVSNVERSKGKATSQFDSFVSFDWELLKCGRKRCRENVVGCLEDVPTKYLHSSVGYDQRTTHNVEAEVELERIFKKEHFKSMKIVGQFNLGFIICRLGNDLFIVDQHASDEIKNFERLEKTVVLNKQPLIHPIQLDLSPADEVIIAENLDIFQQNGFEIREAPSSETDRRWNLTTVPFSRNTTFGPDDVYEIVANLRSTGGVVSGQIPRPSKVRSMLAMRACRSSIMIGKPLSQGEMKKIVNNLSGLDAPWNCPHGRPTMRHLADLMTYRRSRMSD